MAWFDYYEMMASNSLNWGNDTTWFSHSQTHIIEQIRCSVGRPPLGHEPRKRHAIQHLHEEVVLRQRSLAEEGRLMGNKIRILKSRFV